MPRRKLSFGRLWRPTRKPTPPRGVRLAIRSCSARAWRAGRNTPRPTARCERPSGTAPTSERHPGGRPPLPGVRHDLDPAPGRGQGRRRVKIICAGATFSRGFLISHRRALHSEGEQMNVFGFVVSIAAVVVPAHAALITTAPAGGTTT